MATVLVTGGMGFLGAYTAEALLQRGFEVALFDHRERSWPMLDAALRTGRARQIRGDLTRRSDVLAALHASGAEGIIHAAWAWEADPLRHVRVNLEAALTCLEEGKRLRRTLVIGSGGMYGSQSGPVTEDAPYIVTSRSRVYPPTKILLGVLTQALAQEAPGRYAMVIPGGPFYGPGMPPGRESRWPIYDIALAAVQGRAYRAAGGGDHPVEYMHVRDVAEGIAQIYAAPRLAHGVYHVATGVKITVAEIAAAVARLCPGAEITVGPGLAAHGESPGDPHLGPLASARASALGHAPHWTLEQGLADLMAWMREKETA
jgi:UDP-glucose 4-epimerase